MQNHIYQGWQTMLRKEHQLCQFLPAW